MNIRKIFLFIAGSALAFAACDKETASGNGGGTPEQAALPAPEARLSQGTASISAEWPEVEGAEGYRCEVTYISGGRNVDVFKKNVSGTSFTVEALRPKTGYTVRIAAVGTDGKASRNWFMEEVTTGEFNVSFEITPYEVYNSTTGHIDYAAKVTPSDGDVWYWIAAVTYDNKVDAKLWMEEEISYAVADGETWESLVENGYIVRGDAESIFAFNDNGEYMFTAGILGHTGDKINVVSAVSLSYPFYAENATSQLSHPCSYEDYIGKWVLMPYDKTGYSASAGWSITEPEPFNITISAKEQGKSFNLYKWGGADNRFGLTPVVLDFTEADSDRYEHFTISVPQDISTENGVRWAYSAWFSLTKIDGDGNETVQAYAPYDWDYDRMVKGVEENGWGKAFRGFVANGNKTVIKIFGNAYKYSDMNVYMQSLWVCGMDGSGKYDVSKPAYSLNGNIGGMPNAMYYLVRQDVADGLELKAPDVSAELGTAASVSESPVKTGSRRSFYKSVARNKRNI